ncbi:hypothetical protein M231_04079 [Tremella mesenterica]|uniref:Uncharacterized protein n=1 Tax=Tremella mesenterica TaxID=5217 RepID=A0A4Q1BM08_TREME|nr:hypothetical protein M231_04079 [Tremella mesenterica]
MDEEEEEIMDEEEGKIRDETESMIRDEEDRETPKEEKQIYLFIIPSIKSINCQGNTTMEEKEMLVKSLEQGWGYPMCEF